MIARKINHWTNAIQFRTALWFEVQRARKAGLSVPINIGKLLWKVPQNQEEFIWLLRFTDPGDAFILIDIGGNSGYWAETFLTYFPKSKVYGFEPVTTMYEAYANRFASRDNVHIYNVALGKQIEKKAINVSEGFGLTSFHTYSADLQEKNSVFIDRVEVQVDTLDHYKEKIDISNASRVIIKVDVQGFETEVVKGGLEVFEYADLVIMECSFANEYDEALPTFGELVTILRAMDLHPVNFSSFNIAEMSAAFERNVLFIKSKYFGRIYNK